MGMGGPFPGEDVVLAELGCTGVLMVVTTL